MIFALLATILPSLILGWLSYLGNSKLLRQKISHELSHATVQASGELELWIKERLYDLRVFSSSYIISENLALLPGRLQSDIEKQVVYDNVKEYLRSVSDKFGVYEELILINLDGVPVVTSAGKLEDVALPYHWLEQMADGQLSAGKAELDSHVSQTAMLISEAIHGSDGRPLGVLTAKIKLAAIRSILRRHSHEGIDRIYLTNGKGRMLVSSQHLADAFYLPGAPIDWLGKVSHQPGTPADYRGFGEKSVVGMAVPIAYMGWGMVAEMDRDNAYAEIDRLRRVTVASVAGLMLCIGVLAYIFGHCLVLPLRRLSQEASQVASGNLDVDIPVSGLSEVSYLTQVFNHMVASLRRSQEDISEANHALRETNKELHQLSITDGLTGLHNRKHVMDCFDREVARARRYHHDLAVLMLDIDHFKKINDTHGHQAGDGVMHRLAESLLESVREGDEVGRYGGEEFLVILPESNIQKGAEVAERIRQQVSALRFNDALGGLSVSISIGVAGYPCDGEEAHAILSKADDALYRAKAAGRDRVVVSQSKGDVSPNVLRLLPGTRAGAISQP